MHPTARRLLAVVSSALVLAAVVPPPSAEASGVGQVGWWAGETTQQCPTATQGNCPRNLAVYTPAVWKALRDSRSALYLDLVYGVDYGPGATRADGLQLVQRARAEHIAVKAWLTAPFSDGTYANENNAAYEDRAVKALKAWSDQHQLGLKEAVLDLEFPAGYQPVLDATDPAKLRTLRANVDPAHQCAAIRAYAQTAHWAATHGLVLSSTPVPFAVDDLDDGNMGLEDVLDIGPFLRTGYAHVYTQAYRTYSDTGADYVTHFISQTKAYFGSRAEISLGDTTMGPPYSGTADELAHDVSLSVALGMRAIPIFDLDGAVGKYGAAGIKQIGDAAAHPLSPAQVAAATATPDPKTTLTLAFFQALGSAASGLSLTPNHWPTTCDVIAASTSRPGHPRTGGTPPTTAGRQLPLTGGAAPLWVLLLVVPAVVLRLSARPAGTP